MPSWIAWVQVSSLSISRHRTHHPSDHGDGPGRRDREPGHTVRCPARPILSRAPVTISRTSWSSSAIARKRRLGHDGAYRSCSAVLVDREVRANSIGASASGLRKMPPRALEKRVRVLIHLPNVNARSATRIPPVRRGFHRTGLGTHPGEQRVRGPSVHRSRSVSRQSKVGAREYR